MNRLLMAAALIVLAACGGVSTQNGNGTDKEGLNDKVHKVQTLIYNAKSQGNETVKDGKPDSYRETDFFPKGCFGACAERVRLQRDGRLSHRKGVYL